MPRTSATVTVDAQLLWVVRVPELQAGAARAASREQLGAFCAEFDALQAALRGGVCGVGGAGASFGAVALAVLEMLREPPELPFIGEPFGGEDATD